MESCWYSSMEHTHIYIYIYMYIILVGIWSTIGIWTYLIIGIYIYVYIMVHHGLGPHGEQQSQFVNHLVCEHKPYIMGIWSTLGIWSCAFISKIYVPKSFICNDSDESCSHSSQRSPHAGTRLTDTPNRNSDWINTKLLYISLCLQSVRSVIPTKELH